IPEILLDNTDRNRTSAFAFTGNRFEFRAVGSADNCGGAIMVLNTAVSSQLIEFKADVDALVAKGMLKEIAIATVLKQYITICKPIRFDGNGYSEEWKAEAAKRGLDCETSVPKIFDAYLSKQSIELFKKTNILSEVELHSRCEVKWETYTKKIQIEARVLGDLAMNHILPLASRYQSLLLDNVSKISTIFSADEAKSMTEQDRAIIKTIANHISEIAKKTTELISARKVANKIESEREKAIAYHDTVIPVMDELRSHIDDLEMIVDDEMWTLPKYRELLFIR
ncbi:MAG: glutamine synthetase type III, partial [Paludibacteraceae bacterium]|nr:glutamine synthetase type III [Paludibacteraceae bacterium]